MFWTSDLCEKCFMENLQRKNTERLLDKEIRISRCMDYRGVQAEKVLDIIKKISPF